MEIRKKYIHFAIRPALGLALLLAGAAFAQSHSVSRCIKDLAGYPKDCNQALASDRMLMDASSEINNFHQVDRDLYRGARPILTSAAYEDLAKLGIKTVIDLEGGEPAKREESKIDEMNALPNASQILFRPYPIKAFKHTVLFALPKTGDESVEKFFQLLHDSPKPIFLHCQHGKDRTGALVMIYRMKQEQESSAEAFKEAQHYKFSRFNFGLKRTVNRFRDADKLKSLPSPTPSTTDVCRPSLNKCES